MPCTIITKQSRNVQTISINALLTRLKMVEMVTQQERDAFNKYKTGKISYFAFYELTGSDADDVAEALREENRENSSHSSSRPHTNYRPGIDDNYTPKPRRGASHSSEALSLRARESVQEYQENRVGQLKKYYEKRQTTESWLQLQVEVGKLTADEFQEITGKLPVESKTQKGSSVPPRTEIIYDAYSGRHKTIVIASESELPKEKQVPVLVRDQPKYGDGHITDMSQLEVGQEYAVMKGDTQLGTVTIIGKPKTKPFLVHYSQARDSYQKRIDLFSYGLMPDHKGMWSTDNWLKKLK